LDLKAPKVQQGLKELKENKVQQEHKVYKEIQVPLV
jgi:hypothetical protein